MWSAKRSGLVAVFLSVLASSEFAGAQDETAIEKKATMGPVNVTVRLTPAQPVIGDSLTLDILVSAKNDVEVLMPEFGEALGRFQIIDFLPKESLDANGDTLLTQKYRLQSPPSGNHAVPPILIEFVDRRPGEKPAPDGLDAYELFTERINFSVESVLVDDATADLNPPMGRLDKVEAPAESLVSNWAYVGVFAAGLLGVGLTFLAGYFDRRRVLKKTAYEIARRQLDRLLADKKYLAENSIDQEVIHRFYFDLTSIIRKYLENRFSLRAPELTTEEFLFSLTDSAELSDEHKKLLDHFLKHADLVKFAGLEPSVRDIDQSVESATQFLEETRENSPLLEDPETEGNAESQNESAKASTSESQRV